MSSSWKLESSHAIQRRGIDPARQLATAPGRRCRRPRTSRPAGAQHRADQFSGRGLAVRARDARRSGCGSIRAASSTSLQTGTPAARAAATCGRARTRHSRALDHARSARPPARLTPPTIRRPQRAKPAQRRVRVERRSRSPGAAATPGRSPRTPPGPSGAARPRGSARSPVRAEVAGSRGRTRCAPKIAPVIQKRTMILFSVHSIISKWWWNRRHQEHALAGGLERDHLDQHRQRLDHEHRRRSPPAGTRSW